MMKLAVSRGKISEALCSQKKALDVAKLLSNLTNVQERAYLPRFSEKNLAVGTVFAQPDVNTVCIPRDLQAEKGKGESESDLKAYEVSDYLVRTAYMASTEVALPRALSILTSIMNFANLNPVEETELQKSCLAPKPVVPSDVSQLVSICQGNPFGASLFLTHTQV